MKTDRFSDIIRRKLESIRPEFSDKDWVRMQSSLQTGIPQPGTSPAGNPFRGGLWTAKPWLMAAATVSAVVLVGYGFWQQNEINHLRQTIGKLNKESKQQVASNKAIPSTSGVDITAAAPLTENQSQAGTNEIRPSADAKIVYQRDRDTVYITRYVSVPSRSPIVPPEEERPTDRLEKPTEQRYATKEHANGSMAQSNQSDKLTNNPKTDAYGEPSTSSSPVSKSTGNLVETSNRSVAKHSKERRLSDQYVSTSRKRKNTHRPSSVYYQQIQVQMPGILRIIVLPIQRPNQPPSIQLNHPYPPTMR